jgi:hypothetical protein
MLSQPNFVWVRTFRLPQWNLTGFFLVGGVMLRRALPVGDLEVKFYLVGGGWSWPT